MDAVRAKKILADVNMAAKSTDFKHYYDDEKLYLRFTASGDYADQVHVLEITYSDEHPIVPPKLKFMTPIFHPNVSGEYGVCVDTLKEKWSPALCIDAVFNIVISLLADPNPMSPLNNDAARSYDKHNGEYQQLAYSYYYERVLNSDVQNWLKKFD